MNISLFFIYDVCIKFRIIGLILEYFNIIIKLKFIYIIKLL